MHKEVHVYNGCTQVQLCVTEFYPGQDWDTSQDRTYDEACHSYFVRCDFESSSLMVPLFYLIELIFGHIPRRVVSEVPLCISVPSVFFLVPNSVHNSLFAVHWKTHQRAPGPLDSYVPNDCLRMVPPSRWHLHRYLLPISDYLLPLADHYIVSLSRIFVLGC